MMKYRKLKPMSINQINKLLEGIDSEYHLEKLETGEIVMAKKESGYNDKSE